ncbi:nitrous oxide reductase family maturation protein NosD [Rhodanobacter ginsengisoli]|uniref:Nitrous oxide reductase family maturation protein NosD n=1 Tax=Rhodanobacter ginsengisoli TaxID=418646 RepID=A0ABW0QQC9_9GAMM
MNFRSLWLLLLLAAPRACPAAQAPYSLEKAVAAAATGAVVNVPAGVHHVHLHLDKSISLVGSPGAVLDGDGSGDVIRVSASHVRIDHLTIRHSGSDLTAMNAGIYVDRALDDVTVSNNRIENVLFGVYLDGANHVVVNGNTIVGMPELRVPDRGDGIHLWNDTGCTISGNDVSKTRDGIYVYISPDNTIEDNRIHDVRYGVHYMYSKRNLLRGNISHGNTAGFALMASDHLHIIGNQAYDDMSYGLLLNYVNYSEIRGNEVRNIQGQFDTDGQVIAGAEGKAIFVYLSQGNTIADNLLEHSRIGIHVTAGSDQNTIYGNAFVDNKTQVMYVQNNAEEWSWDRRGNYWSNYLGWDLNGDRIGDVPYRPNDGVDVLLWKYPSARVLMSSPSILLMRYVQHAFPVFTPPSVQDSHPLMRIPENSRARAHDQRH